MIIEKTLEGLNGKLLHIKISKITSENKKSWFVLKIEEKNIMHKLFVSIFDAEQYAYELSKRGDK